MTGAKKHVMMGTAMTAKGEMIMTLPNDPHMLVSVINMKLRDKYSSLEDLCEDLELDKDALLAKLGAADYEYVESRNQFL